MTRKSAHRLRALLFSVLLISAEAFAEQLRLAVASNFIPPARALSELFEERTGHSVTLIPGSTGKHYAQIVQGAPFQVFLAADAERPQLLEDRGLAVAGSRFTYALGKLVLWSPQAELVDSEAEVLRGGDFRHLALANPRLAPYGEAAQAVLEAHRLWQPLQNKLVRGESIGQAYQFVASGNAELGFVAYSQVFLPGRSFQGSVWEIPAELYPPIEQQAVLLQDTPAARGFLNFVASPEGRQLIREFGYGTPEID